VTVHDVARLAGVSTASVSRVLSGRRPVTPEVAERVRAAAAELGYEVNTVGRSLRLQSTETVGLVVADITNPFFPSLTKAIEDALAQHGLGLLLADAANDVARERDAVARLLARRVDAILITPVSRSQSRRTVSEASARTTVVQLDRHASAKAHYVGMDNERAVSDVLGHLAQQGCHRPVFIGSDPQISTTWERQRAFARLAPEGARVLAGDFSLDWGRTATVEALKRWPATDALVCADDLIAVGAAEQLRALGHAMPGRVAVVGFDDTMLVRLQTPPVSSVSQPLAEMALAAVALATVGSDEPARRRLFAGALQIRPSSER
jgi:LacI family transcriptional regulator